MGDDDPIARLRAQMDQSREGMKEFAGTMWAFYAASVDEGFTPEQAFGLVVAFITASIQSPRPGSDSE